MYFPTSATVIEFLVLAIVDREDSYGYAISHTIKKLANINYPDSSTSTIKACTQMLLQAAQITMLNNKIVKLKNQNSLMKL